MLLKHVFMAVATPGVEAEEDLSFCLVTRCTMYIHAYGSWDGSPPGGWAEPREQEE